MKRYARYFAESIKSENEIIKLSDYILKEMAKYAPKELNQDMTIISMKTVNHTMYKRIFEDQSILLSTLGSN